MMIYQNEQSQHKSVKYLLWFSCLLMTVVMVACSAEDGFLTVSAPLVMSAEALAPTEISVLTQAQDPLSSLSSEAWRVIDDGLEQRLYVPDALLAQMVALRIDPTRYTFRVHYRPREPLLLDDWRALLPDAVAIINANFFSPEYTAQGLLIADGIPYGQAYTQRGGMFTWQAGVPDLRINWLEPYQVGESIEQAIQAFPMLVIDGQAGFTDVREQRPTRRSIIGIDAQGRVILMATPALGLGLFDLSAYLPSTDIGFVRALNLDGGRSTMLYIAPDYAIYSIDTVPAVLAVYPR